jgi:hypothetical protein
VQRVQRGAPTDPSAAGTGRFGFGLGIDMSSDSAEEAADRALSSVARKLDKALSVEYTVNQLVTAATSTTNLSLIFPGSLLQVVLRWLTHHRYRMEPALLNSHRSQEYIIHYLFRVIHCPAVRM